MLVADSKEAQAYGIAEQRDAFVSEHRETFKLIDGPHRWLFDALETNANIQRIL